MLEPSNILVVNQNERRPEQAGLADIGLRAILAATIAPKISAGLSHNAKTGKPARRRDALIRVGVVESQSSRTVGGIKVNRASYGSRGCTNPCYNHNRVGSCQPRGYGNSCIQNTLSFGGICPPHRGVGRRYAGSSSYTSPEMGRNWRKTSGYSGNAKPNRVDLPTIHSPVLSECNHQECQSAANHQPISDRSMDTFPCYPSRGISGANDKEYAYALGVFNGDCTLSPSSAGSGRGHGFSLLSDISFLIESVASPMMEGAGEFRKGSPAHGEITHA